MKYIFLLLMLLQTGCGLMQTTDRSLNRISASAADQKTIRLNEARVFEEQLQAVRLTTDSAEDLYQVTVWPKGKFSYSPVHGFEGEAQHLVITGNRKNVQHAAQASSALIQGETKIGAELQQQSKSGTSVNQQYRRSFLNWKMLILLTVLFLVIVLVVWKRWQRS